MTVFEKEFNELIIETFHLILKEEMSFVKSLTNYDVSAREIHLIENVGKKDGFVTISEIADALQITLASITVMANKLEGQGYITKKRDETDARVIRLSLTEKGKEIDSQHTGFHRTMVNKISGELTEFEREVLAGGVKKLNHFFKKDLQ